MQDMMYSTAVYGLVSIPDRAPGAVGAGKMGVLGHPCTFRMWLQDVNPTWTQRNPHWSFVYQHTALKSSLQASP